MIVRRSRVSLAIVLLFAWAGQADAQSAAICSFDAAAASVTVTVNGNVFTDTAAHLRAEKPSGEITLDGEPCGGATVLNTDSIQVNGGVRPDEVFLAGTFAPGLTSEAAARARSRSPSPSATATTASTSS